MPMAKMVPMGVDSLVVWLSPSSFGIIVSINKVKVALMYLIEQEYS